MFEDIVVVKQPVICKEYQMPVSTPKMTSFLLQLQSPGVKYLIYFIVLLKQILDKFMWSFTLARASREASASVAIARCNWVGKLTSFLK